LRRILLVVGLAVLMAVMMSVSGALAFADPAKEKNACANGGFANYVDPATGEPFKNQGQCIAALNHDGGPAVGDGDGGDGGSAGGGDGSNNPLP
jgi:hypothetical protein